MKLSRLVLIVSLLASGVLAVSGPGVRLHLWPFTSGLLLFAIGALGALAALVSCAVLLSLPRARAGASRSLLAAGLLALVSSAVPLSLLPQARRSPAINDISTDRAEPPTFVALAPLRAATPNPGGRVAGPEVTAAQRWAYPDIRPLELPMPPAAAYQRALAATRDMGWEVVAADPVSFRIEATATTFWFGFKDDVAIRVVRTAAGSRVDIRSASRVGKGDAGTNARRVRTFLAKLARA